MDRASEKTREALVLRSMFCLAPRVALGRHTYQVHCTPMKFKCPAFH